QPRNFHSRSHRSNLVWRISRAIASARKKARPSAGIVLSRWHDFALISGGVPSELQLTPVLSWSWDANDSSLPSSACSRVIGRSLKIFAQLFSLPNFRTFVQQLHLPGIGALMLYCTIQTATRPSLFSIRFALTGRKKSLRPPTA